MSHIFVIQISGTFFIPRINEFCFSTNLLCDLIQNNFIFPLLELTRTNQLKEQLCGGIFIAFLPISLQKDEGRFLLTWAVKGKIN